MRNKTLFSIIVIVFSIIVFGFVIKYAVDQNNNDSYLKNSGDIVKGIVVERTNFRRYKTYITCRYTFKGKEFTVKEKVDKFEYANEVEIQVGDTLNVFIESGKPKNSLVDLESFINEN